MKLVKFQLLCRFIFRSFLFRFLNYTVQPTIVDISVVRKFVFYFESRGLSKINRHSNQSVVFPQKAANFQRLFYFPVATND